MENLFWHAMSYRTIDGPALRANFKGSVFNQSSVAVELYNIMALDAQVPCVVRSSSAM